MPRFSPLCLLLAGLLLTAPLAVAPVLAQEEPAAGGAETGPDGEAESARPAPPGRTGLPLPRRSEEHTSELQSLMRISYAVFCLKKKKYTQLGNHIHELLLKEYRDSEVAS